MSVSGFVFRLFFDFFGVQLVYNAVLVSGIPQSESVIHMFILFQITDIF